MMVYPVLAVGIMMKIVAVLFVLCCVLLILLVLIQKGRGGGLSSAFGGGGANTLLGSKTGDVLTWATIAMVSLFLMLAVVTAKYYKPTTKDYDVDPNLMRDAPSTQGTGDPASGAAATTGEAPGTSEPVAPAGDANSSSN